MFLGVGASIEEIDDELVIKFSVWKNKEVEIGDKPLVNYPARKTG